MKTRVFIADDHELVRYALRSMLEAEEDIEVVGEAGDTEAAIQGAIEFRPDVLLLDLRMPGDGGIEVCRRVVETNGENTRVLVLTSFDRDEELYGMLSAGACGYLLKDTPPQRIVDAIRAVAAGQAVFDSAVASRVVSRKPGTGDSADLLTDRESDVLRLMAKGMSNKQIGWSLQIGQTTVKTHVSHILHKLGQSDRTQAVLAAIRSGLVRLGS